MIQRKSGSNLRPVAGGRSDLSPGQALRKQYQDVQNEEIPKRLQKLIEALKEAERREKQGD